MDRLGARGKRKQQITNPFQINHALQAGKFFADLLNRAMGEFLCHSLVEFPVEFI